MSAEAGCHDMAWLPGGRTGAVRAKRMTFGMGQSEGSVQILNRHSFCTSLFFDRTLCTTTTTTTSDLRTGHSNL